VKKKGSLKNMIQRFRLLLALLLCFTPVSVLASEPPSNTLVDEATRITSTSALEFDSPLPLVSFSIGPAAAWYLGNAGVENNSALAGFAATAEWKALRDRQDELRGLSAIADLGFFEGDVTTVNSRKKDRDDDFYGGGGCGSTVSECGPYQKKRRGGPRYSVGEDKLRLTTFAISANYDFSDLLIGRSKLSDDLDFDIFAGPGLVNVSGDAVNNYTAFAGNLGGAVAYRVTDLVGFRFATNYWVTQNRPDVLSASAGVIITIPNL
jgi:hypothetical protein